MFAIPNRTLAMLGFLIIEPYPYAGGLDFVSIMNIDRANLIDLTGDAVYQIVYPISVSGDVILMGFFPAHSVSDGNTQGFMLAHFVSDGNTQGLMFAHSVGEDNTQGFIFIPSRNEVNNADFSMEFLISASSSLRSSPCLLSVGSLVSCQCQFASPNQAC